MSLLLNSLWQVMQWPPLSNCPSSKSTHLKHAEAAVILTSLWTDRAAV